MSDERGTYIVTGSYQTESGNMGSFNFMIEAESHTQALTIADFRIKADRRRRYSRALDMSATKRGE